MLRLAQLPDKSHYAMRPLINLTFIVICSAWSCLIVGCASEVEAPPTVQEQAESARENAQEQAEITRKYAGWTTQQLIAERDELERKVKAHGTVVGDNLVSYALAAHQSHETKRLSEINREIERRQAMPKPKQP